MPRLQGERALKGEHALKIITVLFVVIFLAAPPVRADGLAETIALAPPQYRQQLEKQLPLAGKNQAQLLAAIREAPPERREALAVLLAYMPERDLTTLGKDYLLRNVEYACKAHDEMPWGKRIGAEMFHNYVLPYASVNERRDDWRKDFWQRFAGVVRACRTPTEAALLLNKEVYRQFNVKFHAPTYFSAEQSPYESAKTGFASCTGMSILLVSACRSVGIPARLTGSPYWTDKTENHSWVEIWDRQWQPIDAGEPGPFGETWVEVGGGADRSQEPGTRHFRRLLHAGRDVVSLCLGPGESQYTGRRRDAVLHGPQAGDVPRCRSTGRQAGAGESCRPLRRAAGGRGHRPSARRLLPGRRNDLRRSSCNAPAAIK